MRTNLILFGCLFLTFTRCQKQDGFNLGNNFVSIAPDESLESIIKKAANLAPSENQLAWQEMEFTAFVHFTINTFTDREWGDGKEDPALFNPTAFDAGQWAMTCRDAGMKMIIVTAKHHDGFCLWPSKLTDHSVESSPWREGKGDIVREVADACREYGLKFGVYLSPWDRHEASYGDSPHYNENFKNQLRELLTWYGRVDEVWFDGACGEGPNGKRQVYDWPAYYEVIRELQPNAVIAIMGPDVRWVGTESGYGRETEWSVIPVTVRKAHPADGADGEMSEKGFVPGDRMQKDLGSRSKLRGAQALAWYPSEVDVSIRPGWFYHASQDGKVKSPDKLLDIYFSSVGRNSLLLLNIPPDRRGLLHENDVASLMGLRKRLDDIFTVNLLASCSVKASSRAGSHAPEDGIDGNPVTYWMPGTGEETPSIEFHLSGPESFNVCCLQECIRIGQRIEKFELQAWQDTGWKTIARGTTVGYKRLLRFDEINTSRVRLRILESRCEPTLSNISLHIMKPAGGPQ